MSENKRNEYLTTHNASTCYGCGLCEAKCPTGAISMEVNERGFRYPRLDEDKCINCGICERTCPVRHESNTEAQMNPETNLPTIYQVYCKDIDDVLKSQDGGTFTALSDIVLEQGGVIYGASLEKDLAVRHIRAQDGETRDRMHGSKYVQSIIPREIWTQIACDLRDGRKVLFTGTPCQCAAVKKFYGTFENLITLDFVCHGVPSPAVWKKYLAHVSRKHQITIQRAVFRNKRFRKVGNGTESYWSEDGTEYMENDFSAMFHSHLTHRESCFSCQFTRADRYADITMGGYLERSDFDAPYGSSMCIPNTEKGRRLFEEMKERMNWTESRLTYYKNQPCLYHPVPRPEAYEIFWEDWKKLDMETILEKYATDEIKDRFKIRILAPGEDYT